MELLTGIGASSRPVRRIVPVFMGLYGQLLVP
jgi:hypothetical protein